MRARLLENGLAVEDSLLNEPEGYMGVTTWDYDGNAAELVTGRA
ncbi:MAG: hypothetical protein QXT90_04180 [Candidatus Caldarchaeum sp.]